MKVYTIEFGLLLNDESGTKFHCLNQPSFLDIKKANKELSLYLRETGFNFTENNGCYTATYNDGYYIEMYENDVELTTEEIKEIKKYADYPDGTSLSRPIKELFIDNTGRIVKIKETY